MADKTVDERFDELVASIPQDDDGLIAGDAIFADELTDAKLDLIRAKLSAIVSMIYNLAPKEKAAEIADAYNKNRETFLNRYFDALESASKRYKERCALKSKEEN